jgi:hypothetical protein
MRSSSVLLGSSKMGVNDFAVIVLAACQSHAKTCYLPALTDLQRKRYAQRQTKHSAAGSLTWSPTVLMVCWSVELYVWQSRRPGCVDSDTNAITSTYLDYLVCSGGVGVSARPVRPHEFWYGVTFFSRRLCKDSYHHIVRYKIVARMAVFRSQQAIKSDINYFLVADLR